MEKEEEVSKIKQQHKEKMTSVETELKETKTELKETEDKVQGLKDLLRLFLQQNSHVMNIDEALALV